MKANYIINSIISILNEDKFSKYTLSQIYDELGKEDFKDYLEQLCYKIIKSEKIYFLKNAQRNFSTYTEVPAVVLYQIDARGYKESLRVVYLERDGSLEIDSWINYMNSFVVGSGGFEISSGAVDIFKHLKKGIINQCFKSDLVKERKTIEAEISEV
jgi:hypothetical protein